jgi:hypothetical protein
MTDTLDGRYAFRFSGLDDGGRASYFLLGVGTMQMKAGILTGWHRSALMPIQDGISTAAQLGGNHLHPATFALNGTYVPGKHGIWMTTIIFTCRAPAQTMRSEFVFVEAGPSTLWLTSHGSEVLGTNGKYHRVAEMAMGEAIRTG